MPSDTSTLMPGLASRAPACSHSPRQGTEIPAGICVLQEDPAGLLLITELVAIDDPAPAVKLSWFLSLSFIAIPGTESSN